MEVGNCFLHPISERKGQNCPSELICKGFSVFVKLKTTKIMYSITKHQRLKYISQTVSYGGFTVQIGR